ncbi:MAG: filamentous hemagglutinin N-terminal domain-containing protein, partial [Cyanobacteriota bacterium]|nr:filamentous hemagglutinin N-terminal domain-containing protein [Cyanobacteriota bacterium]
MRVPKNCLQHLTVASFIAAIFYAGSVSAQITPDTTLPNNSSIRQQDNIKIIEGGTQAGSNLFHSFEEFSLPTDSTAYFNNPANIQNIITRITGKSISNIDGIIRANNTANLFLINPNGIVFGENAALDIGGSFLVTTASSINFADGTKFSATQPESAPLLTVNVPIGLQFGKTAAPIYNQSQAVTKSESDFNSFRVGLQVDTGKTLALIGGDIILEGGHLTVNSGRIELGSVASNSVVSLRSIDKGWLFGYEGVNNFQNVKLSRDINNSEITPYIEASNQTDISNINIRGNLVELIGYIINLNGGDLNTTARKLVILDGAQINSFTFGDTNAGNLKVNASESVDIIGGFTGQSSGFNSSGIFTASSGSGKAGDITINTSRVFIKDGALISIESSGNVLRNSQFLPATGEGGNLILNATESVEFTGGFMSSRSGLRATTTGSGDAGNFTISTKLLIISDGAEINLNSEIVTLAPNVNFIGDINDLGNAGELNITADSILLDNQGKLISETESANGGNINLQLQDLLLLRRNSQISTNAGKAGLDGDGGNININIPNGFIVAVPEENSDITANAFTGNGGRVDINANGIFGIQPRSRDELTQLLTTNNPSELNPQELLTSDITAISQQNPNLNGELNIVAQDVEPNRELVELPETPVDTKVSQVCRFSRGNQSEFVYVRRGGLPTLPGEALRGDSGLDVGWIDGEMGRGRERERGRQGDTGTRRQGDTGTRRQDGIQNRVIQNRIVEATGWVKDKNGDIFFVAGKDNLSG